MTRRVLLRAAVLVLAAIGVIVGLTLYFSSETVPPCGMSGVAKWRPPPKGQTFRLAVAFPSEAACFVAAGDEPQLVAELRVPGATHVTSAEPNGSEIAVRSRDRTFTLDLEHPGVRNGGLAPYDHGFVTLVDPEHQVMYVTQRRLLGFRVIDLRSGATLYVVHFKGFTWNPRFGPDPPSHGLVLAPDRPELWVLDAPNHAVHLFDVSGLPAQPPRRITDIRLETTMTRSGSLAESGDGRFVYVAGSGDVIDAHKRESVAHFDALEHADVVLPVDWAGGRPEFPGFPR